MDIETGSTQEEIATECPICFENDKEMLALTCPKHHMLCRDCIDKYFRGLYMSNQSLVCPFCRFEVLSNTSVDYINVRTSLMHILRQRMMAHSVQLEYDRQRAQSTIHHRTQYQQVSLRDEFKWERVLLSLVLLAIFTVFIVAIAVMTERM